MHTRQLCTKNNMNNFRHKVQNCIAWNKFFHQIQAKFFFSFLRFKYKMKWVQCPLIFLLKCIYFSVMLQFNQGISMRHKKKVYCSKEATVGWRQPTVGSIYCSECNVPHCKSFNYQEKTFDCFPISSALLVFSQCHTSNTIAAYLRASLC